MAQERLATERAELSAQAAATEVMIGTFDQIGADGYAVEAYLHAGMLVEKKKRSRKRARLSTSRESRLSAAEFSEKVDEKRTSFMRLCLRFRLKHVLAHPSIQNAVNAEYTVGDVDLSSINTATMPNPMFWAFVAVA